MAKRITSTQAADYRAKVLPKLRQAQMRQRAAEREQADALAEKEAAEMAERQKTLEYLVAWLQAARLGELRDMGAYLPRV